MDELLTDQWEPPAAASGAQRPACFPHQPPPDSQDIPVAPRGPRSSGLGDSTSPSALQAAFPLIDVARQEKCFRLSNLLKFKRLYFGVMEIHLQSSLDCCTWFVLYLHYFLTL